MKLGLNTTEMLDWQEVWCFRCEHDHGFSHVPEDSQDASAGCDLLLPAWMGDDIPEFEPRDEHPTMYIPAEVSCSKFKQCTLCPTEGPEAERRQGETFRESRDRLRAETLAKPVAPGRKGIQEKPTDTLPCPHCAGRKPTSENEAP